MSGRPPEGSPGLVRPDLARRDFLKACAAFGLAGPVLSGCASLTGNGRFTRILITDPSPAEYRPILLALIEAVLPFEHPRFPRLSQEWVLANLEGMFPLEEEERLKPLQRTLLILNETGLYPRTLGPLLSEERKNLLADGPMGEAGLQRSLEEAEEHDRKLYAAFLSRPDARGTLVAMAPPARREYLRLWSLSDFTLKRQLYRTTKALVLLSAYTSPKLWAAIGYAGPLPLPG